MSRPKVRPAYIVAKGHGGFYELHQVHRSGGAGPNASTPTAESVYELRDQLDAMRHAVDTYLNPQDP